MIQEMTVTLRKQTPTPPNEWLYQDQAEDYRYFTKFVYLGKDEPEWMECTNEEKEEWEREHEPEPDTNTASQSSTDGDIIP